MDLASSSKKLVRLVPCSVFSASMAHRAMVAAMRAALVACTCASAACSAMVLCGVNGTPSVASAAARSAPDSASAVLCALRTFDRSIPFACALCVISRHVTPHVFGSRNVADNDDDDEAPPPVDAADFDED